MPKKTFFITLFILILFKMGFCQELTIGKPAPVFTLQDLSGKPFNLKDLIGKKTILISFWTVYCSSCIKEFQELKSMYNEFSEKSFEIISIDVRDSKRKVTKIVKENQINFTVLLDSNGSAARLYGVKGVPFNVVIDKKGVIRYQWYELPVDYKKIIMENL